MNHIDNTISDAIDQIQHSDQQPVQAAPEDIVALFARLNPQDVEHFYQSYRFWSIQPRKQMLHREIAELQQAIMLNAQLIDQYRPSPLAQSILAQFQTNGVDDLDLLDQMLERGDDWLDHTMQLLEQCERLDIIHGNYTEWCEHALEGAYDWIGSMSEDDETAVGESEVTQSSSAEIFDESTEQLLLQKLLSEDDSAQTLDLVEQVSNDSAPEDADIDVVTELPTNGIASTEPGADAAIELPAPVEAPANEIVLPATSQTAQDEHGEKQTTEELDILALNEADTPVAEEHSLLTEAEIDDFDEEESAAEFVTAPNSMSETIEVSEAEDEISEEKQREYSTAEAAGAEDDEVLDATTAEVADLVDASNEVLDTATAEVADLVDAASNTLEATEVADISDTSEITAVEPDLIEAAEETSDSKDVTFQERTPLQEVHAVEEIESAPLETVPESSDTISAPEQLNEATIKDEQEGVEAEVASSPASAPAEEEQLATIATGNAEENKESTIQPTTDAVDVEAELQLAIEQPETVQDDAIIEAAATQVSEAEATQDEVVTETTAIPSSGSTPSVQEPILEDDEEEGAIEEPEGEIATIPHETTSQSEPVNERAEADSSVLPSLSYSSNASDSNEDTIAIPKISFLTSRATPLRVPALAKADRQQAVGEQGADQRATPKEEATLIEATTSPNLPAVTDEIAESQGPSKKSEEPSTIVSRAAYRHPQPAMPPNPAPIWREYSTNIGNGYQNQLPVQRASETLPEPRPGFFRRLWRWFLAWLNG